MEGELQNKINEPVNYMLTSKCYHMWIENNIHDLNVVSNEVLALTALILYIQEIGNYILKLYKTHTSH